MNATLTRAKKISGQTLLDGSGVSRRVLVLDRKTMAHVISTVTAAEGDFELSPLPPQILANPYVVMCFDDASSGYGNAMVFDRVYQVDDDGNPPPT